MRARLLPALVASLTTLALAVALALAGGCLDITPYATVDASCDPDNAVCVDGGADGASDAGVGTSGDGGG